jgi:hypothetical protein
VASHLHIPQGSLARSMRIGAAGGTYELMAPLGTATVGKGMILGQSMGCKGVNEGKSVQ